MNRQNYAETLLEHIERPLYYGPVADADIVMTGTNPSCGDKITIYLKIRQNQSAQAIQFEGEGCSISRGAASILMEMVQGKPFAEIEAIDYNDLIDRLGREVVLTRVRCATLGLSILKDAIRQYYEQAGEITQKPD